MSPSSASTYLFYGVFVTVPSLLIAAIAHEKISPPLLGLDLISARSRRGLLATGAGLGAITKLSPELWFLIRGELEDTIWMEAEHELVLLLNLVDPSPNAPLKWSEVTDEALVDDGSVFDMMRRPFQRRYRSLKVSSRSLMF